MGKFFGPERRRGWDFNETLEQEEQIFKMNRDGDKQERIFWTNINSTTRDIRRQIIDINLMISLLREKDGKCGRLEI